MCGLVGIFGREGLSPGVLDALALRMAGALHHRGPDDEGVWADAQAGIALAHRRLSILDLSPNGKQPMFSADGRWVIAFNGEVYNHAELRSELESAGSAPAWRGHSDTETLLAAVSAWGVKQTLVRCTGMFAIALWDRERRELWLARDRLGEKPLYYGVHQGRLAFASELKALRKDPDWHPEIDRQALASFLRLGYVPTPWTIYQGVYKLPAGCLLCIKSPEVIPVPERWYNLAEVAAAGASRNFETPEAAVDELERLMRRSISRQSIADVPLGAFLSGGIDSSAVVAIMQSVSSRPVRTFSVGFNESDYDEAHHAAAVARHLGADHTELYVSPEDALAVIPRLPCMYDEPFGDSSQIPTYLIAALAKPHVTVSLSGDAGDELFGGYNRYFWGRALWRRIGPIPAVLRRQIGHALTAVSPAGWDRAYSLLSPCLPKSLKMRTPGDKLHKLAEVIAVGGPDELYRQLISQQREPGSIVLGAEEPELWADSSMRQCPYSDFTERMMFHDLLGYLSDDILVKVDRAAMAASLETRVPLLDHEIVDFALKLPLSLKIREGEGKWILRQVLYRHVPKALVDRPKQGFGIPLDAWLRGPLKEWADELLDEDRLRRENILNPEPIVRKWREHKSGRRNWQYWLWNVLMFQAWKEQWA